MTGGTLEPGQKVGHLFVIERALWEDAEQWAAAIPEYDAYGRQGYTARGLTLSEDPEIREMGVLDEDDLVSVSFAWRIVDVR